MFSNPSHPTLDASALPLLADLNPEQRAAVTLPNGHALILAGAGSGKTRVLTTRIAWLLHTRQITPHGLLAVTFTNKAAKEMVLRLSTMLPYDVRGMWIGTFHGLCHRLLRTHHQLANLPAGFQILDTQDQLSAIKRLLKQFDIDTELYPPKQVQYFIAGCKEDGQRPAAVQVGVHEHALRKKVELYELYEVQCQREGVVDFGELMLRSYELLRDNASVRSHYQMRFKHILIDEFQDTNRLQYAWIKQLAGFNSDGTRVHGTSVLAVGDDDQSIYAFRGARVGNMADFLREFEVDRQIKLEQNYRSYSNILDAANALIAHNSERLGKNLRTDQGPGEPIRVNESASDFEEAHWIADEIRQLLRDQDTHSAVPATEIAVLYRSNAQSRVIETALMAAHIPYRVYGGLRYFERAEIKHALAYLRLLENPRDDTSFLRVVNFPPRGIGARSIEQLQDAATAAGTPLSDAITQISGKAGGNFAAFLQLLADIREQTQGMLLRDIVAVVLEKSGLLRHFLAERDGADRVENLEELINAAESFVAQEGFGRQSSNDAPANLSQSPASQGIDTSAFATASNPIFDAQTNITTVDAFLDEATGETLSPLAAFLSHASLEAGDNQAQAGQAAVQLMTVHAAKGLEFDCVFISGMEEGLFPHENARNEPKGLEEERRLMYVAITRARKRLYLSHSQTRFLHGQTRYNPISRFYAELPESALKWLTPKRAGTRASAASHPYDGFQSAHKNSAWSYQEKSTTVTAEPLPPQKNQSAQAIRAGVAVFHGKFGEGKVLALEGSGEDARAQISFTRHGVKWLALSIAKLTVI